MHKRLNFAHILTPHGIESDRALVVDEAGIIAAIEPGGSGTDGFMALPGMPDAHSHVFQRALSGFGEAAVGADSFWSWRENMYRLSGMLTPEDMYAVARMGFAEMLAAGFTSVAEFHYLHHHVDVTRGPEMALAVIEAARDVGIGLTLLPVYYRTAGFDGTPAGHAQRRFVHETPEAFKRLLEVLAPRARLGVAPHSLRAVPAAEIAPLLAELAPVLGEEFPIHIHISEQPAEVEACLARHGVTPIQWLAEHVDLGPRWNLVHATHATRHERDLVRAAGGRVVLCPLTEAYLGDGLFAADEWAAAGGQFAIGSDSNCRIDAVEELRCLEFGQRLRTRQRARLADARGLGAPLWSAAARGGAAALGQALGSIEIGRRADLVVLEADASPWLGQPPEQIPDALLVGGSRADLAAVYVAGQRVAEHGVTKDHADIRTGFGAVVRRLAAKE